jgi:hypothetical protein
MLSPNLEHELRTEFVNVGSHIQAPDGLTERLLRENYRPRGRARHLVPLLLCSITGLTFGGVLVAINLSGRQPAAASVLASEFNVFNGPASPSVTLPSKWLLAQEFLALNGRPTATRLLASNPGYGIEGVYAATYPNKICVFVHEVPETGGGFSSCDTPRELETQHAMLLWTSGPSTQSFGVGLVANDVTTVKLDGVVAPVSANNNFFLSPFANGNSSLTVTITLSDGPSMSETFLPAPPPSDGGSHGS